MNRPQQSRRNTTAAKIKLAAARRNGARAKKGKPAHPTAGSAMQARSATKTVAQPAMQPEQTINSIVATTRFSWDARSEHHLSLESVIGVGYGYAALTRDGEPVFEENGQEFSQLMTVAEAEKIALQDPRHDWKIHLVALREDRHYQRKGRGCWELVRRGYGLS